MLSAEEFFHIVIKEENVFPKNTIKYLKINKNNEHDKAFFNFIKYSKL